jgi:hypothetical protein
VTNSAQHVVWKLPVATFGPMLKKTLFLIYLVSIVLGTQAQVTDTLGLQFYLQGTQSLYTSPNGGFAFGNNGYNDRAKARTFTHDKPFVLRKVLLQFGEAILTSNNPNSVVRVNIYDNWGTGLNTFGMQDSIAPDSILAFVDIPVSSIVTDGGYTEVDFSTSTLAIFNSFTIGIDLTLVSIGDTIGLFSTTDGDGLENQDCWEQSANGSWITILSPFSWNLDIDLAIFAMIDENDPAGISEGTTQINVYPNPTEGFIHAEFGQHDNWTVEVTSVEGRTVINTEITSGFIELDLRGLKSGIYMLHASNGRTFYSNRILVN